MFAPMPACAPAGGPASASNRASTCTGGLKLSPCANETAGAATIRAKQRIRQPRRSMLRALACMPKREGVVAYRCERREPDDHERRVHEFRGDEDDGERAELAHGDHLSDHARLEAHLAEPGDHARGEEADRGHEVARD